MATAIAKLALIGLTVPSVGSGLKAVLNFALLRKWTRLNAPLLHGTSDKWQMADCNLPRICFFWVFWHMSDCLSVCYFRQPHSLSLPLPPLSAGMWLEFARRLTARVVRGDQVRQPCKAVEICPHPAVGYRG